MKSVLPASTIPVSLLSKDNGRLQKFMMAAPVATAAAALGLTAEAHAQIVVFQVSPPITASTSSSSGIYEITINGYSRTTPDHVSFELQRINNTTKPKIEGDNGFQIASQGSGSFNTYAQQLSAGTLIGSSTSFASGQLYLTKGSNGPWVGDTGSSGTYIGLSIPDGSSGVYYGWGELTYNSTANTMEFSEFAFNSVAGQSIAAGDTGMSAVPEPANTALLMAAGAAGFALYRQRKSRSAAQQAA